MTKERAALEATRARLEAALASDENWRALRRSHAQSNGDQSEESRARDARLELLLLANPLFRAWKHVDDAIEDLGKTEADVGSPGKRRTLASSLPGMGPNAPKQIASLADLSQGIAKLLQRNLPEPSAPTPAEAAANLEAEAEIETHPVTAAPDEPAARPADAMPNGSPPAAGERKAGSAAPADRPWMVSPARVRPGAPIDFSVDVEEATVTFVTRGPPVARRSGTSVVGPEQQHGHDAAGAAAGAETFYPLGGDIEEAEVKILTASDIDERERTAKREGNLRRFRKALKGD
jgi:hypothetical protein